MNFRTRLMICLNGLLLVTLALVSVVTMWSTRLSMRERAKRDALGTASLLASAVRSALEAPREPGAEDSSVSTATVQRLLNNVVDAGNLEAVFVVKPGGDLAPGTPGELITEYYHQNLDCVASQSRKGLKLLAQFRGDSLDASVPLTGFGAKPGALVCTFDTTQLNEAVSSSLWDIALLSLGGLAAGALIANVLAQRVSGPVRKLAEAATAVGTGEFGHRVKVESHDEVGTLAESFNRMAESLETYTDRLARSSAEKEAMQREMDIASEIQKSLLPDSCPAVVNFDIAAASVPARDVGGDFYDFIPLSEGRMGVVIADVSGKGVPAALLMALSRSLIRAYSHERPSIVQALQLANAFILNDTRSGMFTTCFYAVIDPERRNLTYVNAGHNPPVITRSGGDVVMLPASGTPLGILEEPGVKEEVCQLGSGDLALMYTDGVTEAQDRFGEQFGIERLESVARNSQRFVAAEASTRLLTAVRTFTGDQPQFDDMTAVVLKVL